MVLYASAIHDASAVEYFVDKDVARSGDGTSWSAAWKTFADIRWSAVQDGDTISISGGSTGKTYYDSLVVRSGGRRLSPVLITRGSDKNHDGPVVITGENFRRDGVDVVGVDNVIIRGLTVSDHIEAGIRVADATQGVVIQDNDIHTGGGRGIDLRNNKGALAVIARHNHISTPTTTIHQTDGIWSSSNDGVLIDANVITISNSNTQGHSDGVQSYLDHDITISNNIIIQANSAPYNNHGIWMSNSRQGGLLEVHNNVVLAPNLKEDAVVTHYAEASWPEESRVIFFKNIIVGGRRALNIFNSPLAEVKKNVLQPAAGGLAIFMMDSVLPADRVDGNIICSPPAAIADVQGTTLSWSSWLAHGYDRHGMNAAPCFASSTPFGFKPKGNPGQ